MPEKLLTLKEAADFLRISESDLKRLVETGILPAYKVGGEFLRFRKEQLEVIQNEIAQKAAPQKEAKKPKRKKRQISYNQSFPDSFLDFIYFNDFYIISGIIALIILWVIFSF